jgi:hypothetical protein
VKIHLTKKPQGPLLVSFIIRIARMPIWGKLQGAEPAFFQKAYQEAADTLNELIREAREISNKIQP